MLNKYFLVYIAENTFIFALEKKSKQEYRTTHLRVKLNKKIAACFSRPTPNFSDLEMKVVGNNNCPIFQNVSMKLPKNQ